MGLNLKMPTGPGSNKWAMPSWVVGVGAVDVSAICNITDEGACTCLQQPQNDVNDFPRPEMV